MRCFPAFLLLTILLPPLSAAAPPGSPDAAEKDPVREQLRIRIEAERRGLDALRARGEPVRAKASVLQFYEQRGFTPAWIGPQGPKPKIDSLLAALRNADRDGLNPDGYHVEAISILRQEIGQTRKGNPRRLSDLEFLCTDAFLLYGAHLLTGRVSPTEVTPTWSLPRRQGDLLQTLTRATSSGTVSQAFHSLRPPQPEYAKLTRALRRYRRIAASGGWPLVPEGPTLREGDQSEQVGILRRRLRATGEVSAESPENPNQFDASLREAVIAFQKRHGLEADGVVGLATRAALNVSVEERVRQLRVNIERWRWMPQNLGRRHVIVNIAGFRLRVVETGDEVLAMRVITGRPYRETPVFSGDISYLVFNPYWHVPHSIAVNDKLPEIKKDPGYLARQQFKVFQGWGADAKPIDPATINWSQLSKGNFPYRLRQEPGPLNALGQVKFMFPNRHSVYLHDTPTRGLFARAERGFSSGCIRVERPMDLANYLLADQPQWTSERIQAALKSSTAERSVTLREKVPVHLQYWTAWAEEDGTVHFRKDIYQRDGAVLDALTRSPPSQ